MVQGGILLIATIVISVNLIVDLLYGVINPRIRHCVSAVAADRRRRCPAAPPSPAARVLARLPRATAARSSASRCSACSSSARSFADVIAPYDPNEQFRDFDACARRRWHAGGGHVFLLGTDPVGRDILSRLIHGTRLSLVIGLVSVGDLAVVRRRCSAWSPAIFRGRLPSTSIMRLMDVMLALPSLLLAIAVVADPRPGPGQRDVRDRHRHAAALTCA